MPCTKSEQGEHQMSAAVATRYVRAMAERETRGFGDGDNALRRLEAQSGLSFWTLRYLKQGRAATIDTGVFQRVRAFYLSYCERQLSALQHELAVEKAIEADDDLEDLEDEARKLAAKIAQAKARRIGRAI